ncbi:hypothetical protein MRX96_045020 [Rhipicephalus microplus]
MLVRCVCGLSKVPGDPQVEFSGPNRQQCRASPLDRRQSEYTATPLRRDDISGRSDSHLREDCLKAECCAAGVRSLGSSQGTTRHDHTTAYPTLRTTAQLSAVL